MTIMKFVTLHSRNYCTRSVHPMAEMLSCGLVKRLFAGLVALEDRVEHAADHARLLSSLLGNAGASLGVSIGLALVLGKVGEEAAVGRLLFG